MPALPPLKPDPYWLLELLYDSPICSILSLIFSVLSIWFSLSINSFFDFKVSNFLLYASIPFFSTWQFFSVWCNFSFIWSETWTVSTGLGILLVLLCVYSSSRLKKYFLASCLCTFYDCIPLFSSKLKNLSSTELSDGTAICSSKTMFLFASTAG